MNSNRRHFTDAYNVHIANSNAVPVLKNNGKRRKTQIREIMRIYCTTAAICN